jgi:HK97 gp10 family phage protein
VAQTRIEGIDQLQRELAALPTKVREVVRDAVTDAAEAVASDARATVPVVTGALRDSITTEVGSDGLSVQVSTGLDYGQFVEHGTSRMPAQPFMLPAAEAERGRLPGRLRDAGQRLV